MASNYTFHSLKTSTDELIGPEGAEDAVARYVAILLRWEDLTRQQARYEAELKKLYAQGDTLQADWDALATARQDCLGELHALGSLGGPTEWFVERAWDLFKQHLFVLCQTAQKDTMARIAIPHAITTLSEPLTRNPRLTEPQP
jgi:hypothetical protein